MEINITRFVREAEPCEFSASRSELGDQAGKITWSNAKREAAKTPLIKGHDALDKMRAWAKEFGAWTREEIATWSPEECNALLIQYISGDLRELRSLCPCDSNRDGINWRKAEKLAERGTINGNIFKGADSEIYFYMGN